MTTLSRDRETRHPVDVVADLVGGTDRVLLGWFLVLPVTVASFPEGSTVRTGAVLAFFAGLAVFAHHGHRRGDDRNSVADLQAQYADGEIDLETFEQEVELVLDERADRIRTAVENVGGIGPATSANVALSFRSIDEVRNASPERLEAVNGIGEQRAEAIAERLGGSDS